MSGIFVSIINSTDDPNQLIEKWKLKFGKPKCSSNSCNNNMDLVGRYVKKVFDDRSDNLYIVPLCKDHKNNDTNGIYLNIKTNFLVV